MLQRKKKWKKGRAITNFPPANIETQVKAKISNADFPGKQIITTLNISVENIFFR